MISRRGTTLLLIGIFLLTSGFAFSNYFLVLISSLLILSVVVGLPLFEFQSDVDKIVVERKLDKVKIFADDFVNVTITVKNKGHRSIDFLRINDGFPTTFECVVGILIARADIESTTTLVYLPLLIIPISSSEVLSLRSLADKHNILIFPDFTYFSRSQPNCFA